MTVPGKAVSWSHRLLALSAAAAVSLVLAEGGIRFLEARHGALFVGGLATPEYDQSFVRPHPVLDVEHVPSGSRRYRFAEYPGGTITLESSALGLREELDPVEPKPSDVFRVLVLGDSQTDGLVANHESFVNVAEARLEAAARRADRRRWELLNAGVITYQPVHSYLWWRLRGRRLEPDRVVLAVYLGNDLVDASLMRMQAVEGGGYRVDDRERPVVDGRPSDLLRRCRVCVLASLAVRGGPLESWLARAGWVQSATPARLLDVHRLCRGCMWQSLAQADRYRQRPGQYEKDVDAVAHVVATLAREVREAGAELQVVLLPSKLQVEEPGPAVARVAQRLGLESYLPPLEDRVRSDVGRFLGTSGVPFLDLTDRLRAAYRREPSSLFYEDDWHLNVRGHREVGLALASRLASAIE